MPEKPGLDDFLNPYTFVPAYPRENLPDELADRAPVGHDRLHRDEERWSGTIDVTLTVQTPLLLLDTARAETTGDDHLLYPVLTRDGRPHLPSTSVKGMLRSAYEAVTNSRFGVFDVRQGPNTRALGWRRAADDARQMCPVRVHEVDAENDVVTVDIFQPARLPRYGAHPVTYPDGSEPEHGQVVRARIGRQFIVPKRGNKFPGPWTVRSMIPMTRSGGEPPAARGADDAETDVVTGIVCITGRNAVGKEHERLFFSTGKPVTKACKGGVSRWKELMNSYRDPAVHSKKEIEERKENGRRYGPGEWISDEIGKLAWSPQIWDGERAELKPGSLCYAEIVDGEVLGLFPVLIPRDTSTRTPRDMLPGSLHPAPRLDESSPADRVFGWVAPKGSATRSSSYKGRLRIGPVTCARSEADAVTRFGDEGLPLAVLGQPKPSQGRFYLADSPDSPHEPIPDGVPKEDIFKGPERGLRGRKVYWHHAEVANSKNYWKETAGGQDPSQQPIGGPRHFREYRRPRKAENEKNPRMVNGGRAFFTRGEQRDNQNRSIGGWVNKGEKFSFTIHIKDLNETELGALLWLLTLPPGHFHRLGLGKPLGFGSVRLDIGEDGTDLHNSERWADYYRSLSAQLPSDSAEQHQLQDRCRNAFDRLLEHDDLRHVRDAFLAAAAGVPGLPVHYPRARYKGLKGGAPMPPDPRGRSYSWFVANEKTNRGTPVRGRGRSLPSAESRAPLPTYDEEK
ncbi:TIGR03986 family CRISPR-associated RAMP protein [Actinomadura gamaensis]|uniref:TIGR03986 family CRISPR-associated RAMP protein n=1 Tax=Actinomadura gamaensis TaxID=1763541 RepID=A0ABV9TWH9_9ACTN